MQTVEVTQAARDAAADFYDCPEFKDLSNGCREGLCDDDKMGLVYAFASFEQAIRLTAEQAAQAEIADLRRTLVEAGETAERQDALLREAREWLPDDVDAEGLPELIARIDALVGNRESPVAEGHAPDPHTIVDAFKDYALDVFSRHAPHPSPEACVHVLGEPVTARLWRCEKCLALITREEAIRPTPAVPAEGLVERVAKGMFDAYLRRTRPQPGKGRQWDHLPYADKRVWFDHARAALATLSQSDASGLAGKLLALADYLDPAVTGDADILDDAPAILRRAAATLRSTPAPDAMREMYQRGRAEGCAEMAKYVRDNPPRLVGDLETREQEAAGVDSARRLIVAAAEVYASREFKKLSIEQQFEEPISTALRSEADDGQA